ncbi:hypothetical protein [Roseibium polysiphoniae]|nr:hypothetical protein [Roseibium polysiphoniae]
MTTSTASQVELNRAIRASIDNCDRLIEESYDLEFREPADTRLFLLMIAQEEAAKAFLLYLVREEIITMSREVGRAMNDHACKQLVGILLDYLVAKWETIAELDEQIRYDLELGDLLPQDVGSALEILALEKVHAWRSGAPIWVEDPNYDRMVLKVSKGAIDRRKQDALYVRLSKTGAIASVPGKIKPEEANLAFDSVNEHIRFVDCAAFGDQGQTSIRFEKVLQALQVVFGSCDKAPT